MHLKAKNDFVCIIYCFVYVYQFAMFKKFHCTFTGLNIHESAHYLDTLCCVYINNN